MKYKHGVFLARMQPLHVAHIFLAEEALKECDTVHICLGSANKKDMIRNPFTIEFRKQMLIGTLIDMGYGEDIGERINVFELPDWSYENDVNDTISWGRYFYYNMVSRLEAKTFAMYYSDDSSIIHGWFDSEVKDRIVLRLFDRTKTYEGLSATRIREAIVADNRDYLERFMPQYVLNHLQPIKEHYTRVLHDPEEDFAMV